MDKLKLNNTNSSTFLLLLLFLHLLFLAAQPIVHGQSLYHVKTIAGSYPYGYNGDDIEPTKAEITLPDGLALSPSNNGDIFIVDKINCRVRQVVASSGKIKTIVGVGIPGSVTTTIATMARLNYPSALAFQNSDVMYLSDNSHVIRKVVLSSNLISTYAGQVGVPGSIGDDGVAINALLNTPSGIAISPVNNNLYIADTSNNKIRVVSYTDGIIRTFAGGGTDTSTVVQDATNAQFNFPTSIAISNSGEVYIGDDKIRKVFNNGTSVLLFTSFGLSGQTNTVYGMAVSPITGALYVTVSDRVYMIQSNGVATLIAGSGAGYAGDNQLASNAMFRVTRGIAISSSGEIFISDGGNNRVRKINTNNIIATVAGTGSNLAYNGDNIEAVKAKLFGPESVAVAPNNEVIVADTRNDRLRKISLGGIITTITPSYSSPRSPLVPNVGEYYFVDSSTVKYLISSSGIVITKAGSGTTGYNADNIPATSAHLNFPKGIARSTNGDLFITDSGNHRIRKVFLNQTIITVAGTGTSAYNGDGLLATSANINNPYGIVLTSNNEVIFSEYEGHRVRKILNDGTLITIAGTGVDGYSGENLSGSNSMLRYPAGLAILSNDELLISDSQNHAIRKLFKNGTLITIAGTAPLYGYNGENLHPLETQFYGPMGVALSADESKIFIADTSNGKVRAISFGCDLQNQCSGHGDCAVNNCSCYSGWRGSSDCSLFSCETLNACSGLGTCVSNNTCSCTSGWKGSLDCSHFSCETLNNCSGHGACVGPNTCSCDLGWKGSLDCSFSCEKLNACSGHGVCVSNNTCVCDSGWKGSLDCNLPSCEMFKNCSGHGSCLSSNTCSCLSGWKGSLDCSLFSCDAVKNCSGNGTCTSSNGCSCLEGYGGLSCDNRIVPPTYVSPLASKNGPVTTTGNSNIGLIVGLVVGLTLLVLLILLAIIVTICLIVKLKKKKSKPLVTNEEPIEMITTIDENVTQTANSSLLTSDFPSDTFNNSYYQLNSSNTNTSATSPPQNTDHSLLKDRYKIQQVIGQGAFGKCYLCLDSKKNDMPVAIKTISYDQSRHSKIIDECSKTLSYRHANLVEVYEFFEAQIIQSICIVMKFYEGDLEHALKDLKQDGKIVSEKMIISIMKQLGDGLNYLHQEKLIVHRDIKPRNIFYSKLDRELDEIQVVIGDYGEAKETGETQNSVAGTLQYMAPEVFSRKYSYSADIFSLGVSLIQAMANESLDLNITAQLLYDKEEVVLDRTMEHLISRGYSEKLCNFIVTMVSKEPSMRPTSADIQNFTQDDGAEKSI
ncbi:NHL repeat-containing protein [Naegleria gruberi]|uniref:NHL repeat-containing protein n=1 Tax=Naegleria gruberi TaxID=5762 RepID=D2VI20_NAEGR|nr:NHL repeat-containing protein [Naegleria gruberi]EFC43440.1 NHL repeat-containing protein [Naegleria gruberi]|eukprot:XP_002676184.1 NHL repeat-containing protein [Naegleria gruberi strain NEG-M]